MSFYVYILSSITKPKYYVGMSSNPKRRLEYHNSIEKGFTSRYRPWKLIFEQKFDSKFEALAAERKIKKWKSRKMIEKLIVGKINLRV